MKSLIIIPSVRCTDNFSRYAGNFKANHQDPDVVVIDEVADNRKSIKKQLSDFNVEFYGMEERAAWFHRKDLAEYKQVIPVQAHNELSFGLLLALERSGYDMVVCLDDDTYPARDRDFLGDHWRVLNAKPLVRRAINGSWVNTHPKYHSRGLPYCQRWRKSAWFQPNCFSETVLNMGLWTGVPDLNAIDYLCLNPEFAEGLAVDAFTVARSQFSPICSMNVAFRPEVIPAYYQLWHNDRYDDIFSGLFLKVVADHLNKAFSVGNPLVVHEKAPRDLFRDAEREFAAMKLNEELWKTLLEIKLTGSSWLECYRELAIQVKARAKRLNPHYIQNMTEKMLLWCDLIEKLID